MAAQQEGKVKSVLSGDTLILTNNARQERVRTLASEDRHYMMALQYAFGGQVQQ